MPYLLLLAHRVIISCVIGFAVMVVLGLMMVPGFRGGLDGAHLGFIAPPIFPDVRACRVSRVGLAGTGIPLPQATTAAASASAHSEELDQCSCGRDWRLVHLGHQPSDLFS